MNEKQLAEIRSMNKPQADKFMSEGDKLASRTLFRWKPDYDSAATSYEKAANIYRKCKLIELAKNAFIKTGEAHYNADNYYLAGKAIETAGDICRDDKKINDAIALYEKASRIYREDGKADRGAEMLVKAGKLATDNQKAIKLFKDALEIYTSNDSHHKCGDVYRHFNAFLLKNKLYDECIENINLQIKSYIELNQTHNIWKAYLSIVIIYLTKEDYVRALEAHQKFIEYPGYSEAEESSLAQQLLDAYENRDEEELQNVTSSHKFTYLENQVGKLAKSLKIFTMSEIPVQNKKSKQLDEKKQELFGDDEKSEEDDENNEEFEEKPKKIEDEEKEEEKPKELDAFDPNNIM